MSHKQWAGIMLGDEVAKALGRVKERASGVRGLKLTYQAPVLRHFTAKFERA